MRHAPCSTFCFALVWLMSVVALSFLLVRT